MKEIINNLQAAYDQEAPLTAQKILIKYIEYALQEISQGENPSYVFKPLLRIYTHCYHAKTWRQQLTKFMHMNKDDIIKTCEQLLTFKDPRNLVIQ